MYEARELIEKLDAKKKQHLDAALSGAPNWLTDQFQAVRIPAGTTFVNEGEPAKRVFVLLKGRVSAVDYRVHETVYGFFHFSPVYLFGVMEILGGMEYYKTSLVAIDDCLLLRITRERFELWVKNDIDALRRHSQIMIVDLLEQARKERLCVLLSAHDRICQILINFYESYADGRDYRVYVSRKDFSEMTNLSERTVTRAIKELEAEGMIQKDGWDITITKEQYQMLKNQIDQKMNEMEPSVYPGILFL